MSTVSTLKNRIVVVYSCLEWWLCYVKDDRQGYCDMVILRNDLAADQLSYFGSSWQVQLGEDISDYVGGLDNSLDSAVGFFGTSTMLRNPYCDLCVAVGDANVPLYMSSTALKRCRSLTNVYQRSFFKKLGQRYYSTWFTKEEQCRRCHDTMSSRPSWSLRHLLDMPSTTSVVPPLNLAVFTKSFLSAEVPFYLCLGKRWLKVTKLVFPKQGRAVQLSAVVVRNDNPYYVGYVTMDDFLSVCHKARDCGLLVFLTERLPSSLVKQQQRRSVPSPSTISAADTLLNIAKASKSSSPTVLGKRKKKGPTVRTCGCKDSGMFVCQMHNRLVV